MASATVQLADQVVDTINDGVPYAVELRAERLPIAHITREEIEELTQVIVVAGTRDSALISRKAMEREYPVQIVIDKAVSTKTNSDVDNLHEAIEQIQEQVERSIYTIDSRQFAWRRFELDADNSGLTEGQHLIVSMVAFFLEIHAT